MRGIILGLAGVLAGAGPVYGQPASPPGTPASAEQQAKNLSRAARALGNKGEYGPAIILYKRSHRIYPRSYQLCNIGFAYRELERPARSHLFLTRCTRMARAEGKKKNPAVAATLAAVETQLRSGGFGRLRIDVTPSSAATRISLFETDEAIIGSRDIWVPSGDMALTIAATGYVTRTVRVRVRAGQLETLRARLDKTTPPPAKVSPKPAKPKRATPLAATAPGKLTPAPSPTVSVTRSRPRWALGVVGVGVASLAIGAVFHVRARNTLDEIGELEPVQPGTPNLAFDSKASDYRRYRRYTYGAYAGGVVITGVGAFLYLRGKRSERRVQAFAAPSEHGAMAWLWTRF